MPIHLICEKDMDLELWICYATCLKEPSTMLDKLPILHVWNGKKYSTQCAFISFLIDSSFHASLLLQAPRNPSSVRQLTSGNNEPHLARWRWRHLVPATARHQAKRQYTHTGSVVLFNEHIWANTWLPGGHVATPWRPGRVLPLLFKPGGIKGGP